MGDDPLSLHVLGRLQAACASDTTASLLAAHMTLSSAGRLHSATAEGVVLEIANPPTSDVTLLGCAAAVRFPTGQGVAGFVERITAVRELPDGSIQVTLAIPGRLHLDDRRAAVRIPVPRGALRAAIIDAAGRQAVMPVDISLTGILVEVDTSRGALEIGRTLELELALGEDVLVVGAQVCRRDRERYGLRYDADKPTIRSLAKIIYILQEPRRPKR